MDGLTRHLSRHQTSAILPPQERTPAIASFSLASSKFPVYSTTRYFPLAYKHAVSSHILKKEPLLTHASSSCHSISQIFFTEKLVEQIAFMFVTSFSPFILSWSHPHRSFVPSTPLRPAVWRSHTPEISRWLSPLVHSQSSSFFTYQKSYLPLPHWNTVFFWLQRKTILTYLLKSPLFRIIWCLLISHISNRWHVPGGYP